MRLYKNRWARWGVRLVAYPLAVVLLLRWFEYKSVFHPTTAMSAEASQLSRAAEDVFIPVDNGGKIEAWFFPAAGAGPAPARKVILVCHGNGGNISDRLDLGGLLLETGASVLLFDYRGYGRSPGRPGEEKTYRDAEAAWQWLRQKGFAGTNIIAYGESLGGAIATELAVREELGGIILQSAFTSVPDMGADLYPWLPFRQVGSIKYDTHGKLPRVKVPVLILHSRDDTLVNFKHGERNFAAASQPKYFCEIHGDHNDGILTSRTLVLSAINEFLRRL